MHLELECPVCGQSSIHGLSSVGSTVSCRRCDSLVVVPEMGKSVQEFTAADGWDIKEKHSADSGPSAAPERPVVDHVGLRILSALFFLAAASGIIYSLLFAAAWFEVDRKITSNPIFRMAAFRRPDQPLSETYQKLRSQRVTTNAMFFGLAVLVWAESTLQILAALSLRKATNRGLCLVVAIIACLSYPLGTVLGIVTLVLLRDEKVKRLFE